MRILTCPPEYFGVDYVINPWMDGQIGRVDRARARGQWETLFEDVARVADIEQVAPLHGHPDMCFSANAGLVEGRRVVPGRFRMRERRGEEEPFVAWFERAGLGVHLAGDDPFEGEGDALFQPGEPLLWAGYGVRTALATHPALARTFSVEVESLRLVDQRFYHLDTCFLPLPGGRLVYYPAAFDARSRARIEARIPAARRIAIDDADARRFACNALRIGDRLFVHDASPELRRSLSEAGFEVRRHPVDEYLKAGGGVKCLSLLLDQAPFERGAGAYSEVVGATVELQGHLLDAGLLRRALDVVSDAGGSFQVDSLDLAERTDQASRTTLRIAAPDPAHLETMLSGLAALGALRVASDPDADGLAEPAPSAASRSD